MKANLGNSAPIIGLPFLAMMIYLSSVGFNLAPMCVSFLNLRHATSSLVMGSIVFLNSSFFTWSAMSNAFGKFYTTFISVYFRLMFYILIA